MIRYYPAVQFGTIDAETIRIVGVVPTLEKGILVRGLRVYTTVEIAPSNVDYWVVYLGTIVGQMEFIVRGQFADPFRGIAVGENAVSFQRPVVYSVSEVMALQAVPFGSPSDLTLLEVVVDMEEP